MTFEKYFKEYEGWLRKVRGETCKKFPQEVRMLFEFINNWTDLLPRSKEIFNQAIHSLSGIILLHSWKLANWITYEILCGKYFEAIRDLRFVFEGTVYAVIVEDAIESKMFEKWGSLSKIDLKEEIFELWEICKRKKVGKKGKMDADKIKRIVTFFVNQRMRSSKSEEVKEYVEVFTKILSDKRLYLSTSEMVKETASLLGIDEDDVGKLRELWHELSRYLHFSYLFLEAILNDPELLLIEKSNDDLFKKSLNLYFETLDFFYSVLAWRFPSLGEKIKEMIKWWENNFNKTFRLTGKFLKAKT